MFVVLDIERRMMYGRYMTSNASHINRIAASAIVAAGFVGSAWFGMSIARADEGMVSAEQGMVSPHVPTISDQYAWEVGDDNADGRIDEDESGWDWRTMGNGCGTDVASVPVTCVP